MGKCKVIRHNVLPNLTSDRFSLIMETLEALLLIEVFERNFLCFRKTSQYSCWQQADHPAPPQGQRKPVHCCVAGCESAHLNTGTLSSAMSWTMLDYSYHSLDESFLEKECWPKTSVDFNHHPHPCLTCFMEPHSSVVSLCQLSCFQALDALSQAPAGSFPEVGSILSPPLNNRILPNGNQVTPKYTERP
jgi:hypothetical protein